MIYVESGLANTRLRFEMSNLFTCFLGIFVVAVVTGAAVRTILVTSLFENLRTKWEHQGSKLLPSLMLCPDCLGHWVSMWGAVVVLYVVRPASVTQAVATWLIIWLGSWAVYSTLHEKWNFFGIESD